ncbi:hypothetical protein CK203_031137 [Vitis vinifera]|uniref:Uncharacterized protein n=1 Tax=Vitis vinifera TaxID=29760 RepID=A0A438J0M1_VITVI|nr:hypothetical protein CK203_031137 [Vitis vinifera]
MIEATCDDSENDEDMKIVSEVQQEDVKPEISLHATAGLKAPNTTTMTGSFLFQPMEDRKMEVMVASGEKLVSLGSCSNVQLKLQKVTIVVKFLVLPLEDFDVV